MAGCVSPSVARLGTKGVRSCKLLTSPTDTGSAFSMAVPL